METDVSYLIGRRRASDGPCEFSANPVQRWDEWVPEQRLLKLNEIGFARRRALLDAQAKKGRPGSTESPVPSKGKEKSKKGEGSKKRGRDSGMDTVSYSVRI
jgi:hypothetical protein